MEKNEYAIVRSAYFRLDRWFGCDQRLHSQPTVGVEALKRDPGLRIAGSATSSKEFLEIAERTNPSVVIMSAHLDDDPYGGMATLKQFHDAHPRTPAILLVDSPKSAIVLDAFRAGARGIFSEYESLETLRKCVRVVFEGQVWAPSREVCIALEGLSSVRTVRATVADRLYLLTRRQQQVVSLLAEGLANREIGDRLGLRRHPIKNYFVKIFDMVGVSNRVELLFLTLTHPDSTIEPYEQVQSLKKSRTAEAGDLLTTSKRR